MQPINLILVGAIGMGSIIVGLFFLRFWSSTNDRFFLFFAASFLIEGCNRIYLGLMGDLNENVPIYYLIRLVTYVLIVVAILDKNRGRKKDKL